MQQSFIGLRKERPKEAMALVAAIGEMDTSSATSKLWAMFCSFITGSDSSTDPMHLLDFEVRPVINVLNGHIEFNRKGEHQLVPHDPSLFLTSQIPLEYDPEADTAHWDSFCELLFHDSLEPDVMQRHLEEVGGYIIQPWRDLATFFLMKGSPAAGKSTFGAVINRMMGRSVANRAMEMYQGQNTHAEAGLVGKLLLLDEDFDKGALLPAGFVKRISEAKHMTANPKGKDEFEFVCRAVPMVISNHWPPTRDHSGALDRRLVCWDLPSIPMEDRDDDARRALLTDGMQGVLRAMVEGFARLYKRQRWDLPQDCVEAGARWLDNTDVVASWVKDTCVVDAEGVIARSDVMGLFKQWYSESVPGAKPIGKQELFRRIRGKFGPECKRGGEWVWTGWSHVGSDFDTDVG
jgi:putative DNA primase/helicase